MPKPNKQPLSEDNTPSPDVGLAEFFSNTTDTSVTLEGIPTVPTPKSERTISGLLVQDF